jgi:imidazolonepropionase-like amidohydrolase
MSEERLSLSNSRICKLYRDSRGDTPNRAHASYVEAPMHRLLASCSLTLALLLLGTSAHAQAPAVAIRGATVIDVSDGSLERDQTVLVEGNRITAVGPVAEVAVPPGAEVVEAAGGFVVPGLWDMHVHATNQEDVRTYLTLFIANGITGFREPWGSRETADSARAEIAAGRLAGPVRQVVAGALIDGPARFWPGSLIALTPDDGRRIVDSLYVAGAPFLKVYESLLPETYFAIAERARALGIPLAGHVAAAVSAGAASDAGLRSMEHFSGVLRGCSTAEDSILADNLRAMQAAVRGDSFRPPPGQVLLTLATQDDARCRALAQRFARNGTWQVPTLLATRGYAHMRELAAAGDPRMRYLDPRIGAFWTPSTNPFTSAFPEERWASAQAQYRQTEALVSMMVAAGVLMLAGSDTPNPWVIPGFGLHDELELLVQAGLTPLQALQAATLNPARFLGRTDELGTVAIGRLADLLVLEANPLDDITSTRRIRAVVADGRLYRRPELDRMLEELAARQAR